MRTDREHARELRHQACDFGSFVAKCISKRFGAWSGCERSFEDLDEGQERCGILAVRASANIRGRTGAFSLDAKLGRYPGLSDTRSAADHYDSSAAVARLLENPIERDAFRFSTHESLASRD